MSKKFGFFVAGLAILLMPRIVTAATIFAIDGVNDEIVILDSLSGAELGRLPTPEISSGGPDGLAADGGSIFFINGNGSNQVYRIDLDTGTVFDVFPAPSAGWGTDGLAVSSNTLFNLEPAADTIHRTSLDSMESAGSCVTGRFAGGGLAAENGRLFATLGLASIVELNPETCEMIGGPFPIPGGDFTYGLAFDGERLYTGRILSPGVVSMDPDTGEVLGSFSLDFAPTGLAASSAEPPVSSRVVPIDIRPGSDRNVLNVRSRGRMPVALFGSGSEDVGTLDLDSLALAGVPAEHSAYGDLNGDGILDLILHFRTQALVRALEAGDRPLENGMTPELVLDGRFLDGTPCTGTDSVTILGAGSRASGRRGSHRNAASARRSGGR